MATNNDKKPKPAKSDKDMHAQYPLQGPPDHVFTVAEAAEAAGAGNMLRLLLEDEAGIRLHSLTNGSVIINGVIGLVTDISKDGYLKVYPWKSEHTLGPCSPGDKIDYYEDRMFKETSAAVDGSDTQPDFEPDRIFIVREDFSGGESGKGLKVHVLFTEGPKPQPGSRIKVGGIYANVKVVNSWVTAADLYAEPEFPHEAIPACKAGDSVEYWYQEEERNGLNLQEAVEREFLTDKGPQPGPPPPANFGEPQFQVLFSGTIKSSHGDWMNHEEVAVMSIPGVGCVIRSRGAREAEALVFVPGTTVSDGKVVKYDPSLNVITHE